MTANQRHDFMAYPKRKGLATASLIFGILSMLTLGLGLVGAVVGIVLGVVALRKAVADPERYGGKARAVAGTVMSVFSIILGVGLGMTVAYFQSTRIAANETETIATLKTIRTAQTQYAVSHDGRYGSPDQLVEAGLLDKRFAGDSPVIGGYVFSFVVIGRTKVSMPEYAVNADPIQAGGYRATGRRYFYTDSTVGDIRVNEVKPATDKDPPL